MIEQPRKSSAKKGITIREIEVALRACDGILTHAATALGMNRKSLWYRVKRSEKLQELRADIKESNLDLAENGLIGAIRDREPWAICFYLKTQGHDRGYGPQPQQDQVQQVDLAELAKQRIAASAASAN